VFISHELADLRAGGRQAGLPVHAATSDSGGETLARLEAAVDALATAYGVTTPAQLLDRVWPTRPRLSAYQRPRHPRRAAPLLVVGGWLWLRVDQ
jgi:hypothetical protein